MWYTNIVYSRRKVREKFRRTEEIPALGANMTEAESKAPEGVGAAPIKRWALPSLGGM